MPQRTERHPNRHGDHEELLDPPRHHDHRHEGPLADVAARSEVFIVDWCRC